MTNEPDLSWIEFPEEHAERYYLMTLADFDLTKINYIKQNTDLDDFIFICMIRRYERYCQNEYTESLN